MQTVISQLNHWYFEKKKDTYRVWGNVSNHPHFTDGQWIRSSLIKEVIVQNDCLYIKTAHSCYEAAFGSRMDRDQRTLRKALHDYVWPDDEETYTKILSSNKEEEKFPTADECSTCTVFVFGTSLQEVQLKYRSRIHTITSYDVHSGFFQDVTEISDPKLDYCYRFFSFQKNCYEFEEWTTKYAPVYLKNTGKEMIYASTIYGDFQIAPGTCCALDAKQLENRVSLVDVNLSMNRTTVLSHESLTPKKQ